MSCCRGNGPSFCSGGDLDEFGTRPDPATAHVTRLARSPARLIYRLRTRITVQLHGAAFGGGIEMAAFADIVEAHPDTRIALPEVGLGLIPGAGGTVSVTSRIGRQRTAALALSGREIDAQYSPRMGPRRSNHVNTAHWVPGTPVALVNPSQYRVPGTSSATIRPVPGTQSELGLNSSRHGVPGTTAGFACQNRGHGDGIRGFVPGVGG